MSAIAAAIEAAIKGARTSLKPTVEEILEQGGKQAIEVPAKIAKTSDIAHISSQISESGVEHLFGVGAKKGTPVNVARLRAGELGHVKVDPLRDIGAMTKKDIDTIYFSHNHPSGNPKFSIADKVASQRMTELLEGSGYRHGGTIASTPSKYSFTVGKEGAEKKISSATYKEISERRKLDLDIFDLPHHTPGSTYINENIFKMKKGQSGVFLLGSKRGTFIPATTEEMAKLRTGDKKTLFGKILRSTPDIDTLTIVPRVYGERSEAVKALENMEKFMNAFDRPKRYYIYNDKVKKHPRMFDKSLGTKFKAIAPIGVGLGAGKTFIQGNSERRNNDSVV